MSKAREEELQKTIDTLTAELKATRESAARDRKEDRRALENLQDTIFRKTKVAGDTVVDQVNAVLDHDKLHFVVSGRAKTIIEAKQDAINQVEKHLPSGYIVKSANWASDSGWDDARPLYDYGYDTAARVHTRTINQWDISLRIQAERSICDD